MASNTSSPGLSLNPVLFCLLALAIPTVQAIPRSYNQFQNWYPQFGFIFSRILDEHCAHEYHDIYLYGTHQNVSTPWDTGGGRYTKFIQPTIKCLMENTIEYIKGSLSVSQLQLGLAPTILALGGASSLETSFLAVVGKRPILSILVALGSPGLYIERAFQYPNPSKTLKDRDGRYRHDYGRLARLWDSLPLAISNRVHASSAQVALLILEYVLVLAAVANVLLASWELGNQAIFMMAPNFVALSLMWPVTGVVVHVSGWLVLGLRAKRVFGHAQLHPEEEETSSGAGSNSQRNRNPWRNRVASFESFLSRAWDLELTLLGNKKQESRHGKSHKIHVEWRDESELFLVLSWLHSLFAIGHLIFGTILFSGNLFIGPTDALWVFLRYVASGLLCRVVLMFELAGLRESYNADLLLAESDTH
ncbi:hypothetical protein V8F20_003487 [Naviculisporaceae sp. PSN 640]